MSSQDQEKENNSKVGGFIVETDKVIIGRGSGNTVVYNCRRAEPSDEYFCAKYESYIDEKQMDEVEKIIKKVIEEQGKKKFSNVVKHYFIEKKVNFGVRQLITIMERCDSSLQALMEKQTSMTEDQAKKIMNDIVNGCRELHQVGILHRDLKPDNILLHDKKYKLADFNSSKIGLDDCCQTMNCGNSIYLAPELFNDTLDDRSHTQVQLKSNNADIYTLGLIFFQMIFGRLPHINKKVPTELEVIHAHRTIQTTKLKSWFIPNNNNQISQDTRDLLLKMLNFNPNNRISWDQLFNHIYFRLDQEDNISTRESPIQTQKSENRQIKAPINFQQNNSFNRTKSPPVNGYSNLNENQGSKTNPNLYPPVNQKLNQCGSLKILVNPNINAISNSGANPQMTPKQQMVQDQYTISNQRINPKEKVILNLNALFSNGAYKILIPKTNSSQESNPNTNQELIANQQNLEGNKKK